MALNIKNERVHELARVAARRTGATQVSALEAALEQYLAGLDAAGVTNPAGSRVERARAIAGAMRDSWTDADRAAMKVDLEAMYDEHGLPA